MTLSTVELVGGAPVRGGLAGGGLAGGGLAVVEQPDGLPADRVSGRIGQPEEHAQVRGRGQRRLDVLPTRRLQARRDDVVWNR